MQREADGIFDQLWAEITLIVDAARVKGIGLLTNGSPRNRKVLMPATPKPGENSTSARELRVDLSVDRRRITATGSSIDVVLEIGVCPDGVVCIMFAGERITLPVAGRRIMETFLSGAGSPYETILRNSN